MEGSSAGCGHLDLCGETKSSLSPAEIRSRCSRSGLPRTMGRFAAENPPNRLTKDCTWPGMTDSVFILQMYLETTFQRLPVMLVGVTVIATVLVGRKSNSAECVSGPGILSPATRIGVIRSVTRNQILVLPVPTKKARPLSCLQPQSLPVRSRNGFKHVGDRDKGCVC
jgi:hypothetical protein